MQVGNLKTVLVESNNDREKQFQEPPAKALNDWPAGFSLWRDGCGSGARGKVYQRLYSVSAFRVLSLFTAIHTESNLDDAALCIFWHVDCTILETLTRARTGKSHQGCAKSKYDGSKEQRAEWPRRFLDRGFVTPEGRRGVLRQHYFEGGSGL